MVLLLNLAVGFIILVGSVLTMKFRSPWIAAVTVATSIIYTMAQPSYMPKGEVKRSDIPLFEQKGEIEDRNSKPKSGEVYDSEREAAVKEGLKFN